MTSRRKDDVPLLSTVMLNQTDIERRLRGVDFVAGSAPRWVFIGKVRNVDDPTLNTSVAMLFLNSSKELSLGLGREFPQRALKDNVNSRLRCLINCRRR